MRYREIWPFLIGKLITDPVWWFYLFWLPSYLDRERGQNPLNAGLWVAVIYTGSSVGSILGGWLSGTLMKRGWTVGKARMTTMALAAVFMPGSILAYYTESFGVCVAFITLATACHQAWSANLFTNATDLFPQKVSGSVVGLGATAGGIGGMFMTLLAGLAVQWTGNSRSCSCGPALMHLLEPGAVLDLVPRPHRAGRRGHAARRAAARIAGSRSPGAIVALAGVALAVLVSSNWDYLKGAVKITGAVQSGVVAAAVFLIGAGAVLRQPAEGGPGARLRA